MNPRLTLKHVITACFYLFIVLVVSACSSGGNSAPAEPPPATTPETHEWLGTYQSNLIQQTMLHMELTQDSTTISGNYHDLDGDTGTISGELVENTFQFTAVSTDPNCAGSFIGSGTLYMNVINFTFTGDNCLGTHSSGEGVIAKQVGTVVTFGTPSPKSLTLSGTRLYWLDDSDNKLKSIATDGTGLTTLASRIGVTASLIHSGTELYWIEDTRLYGATIGDSQKYTLDVRASAAGAGDRESLVTDGTNLYWVVEGDAYGTVAIRKVPLDGSATQVITTTANTIRGMASDGSNLYWIEEPASVFEPLVKKMSLSDGAITTIHTGGTNEQFLFGFTVDTGYLYIGVRVYPVSNNQHKIIKIPTTGGSVTAIGPLTYVPIAITAFGGTLYWIDDVSLQSVSTAGGTPAVRVTTTRKPYALDVSAQQVVWAEGGSFSTTGSIQTLSLSSGVVTTLVTDIDPANSVFIHDNGDIYWSEGDLGYAGIEGQGGIYKLPLGSSVVRPVITGLTSGATGIAVANDTIYVADTWRIKTLPTSGGPVETLISLRDGVVSLATDGTNVYWIEGPLGKIRKISLGDGAIADLAVANGPGCCLAADNSSVYWTANYDTISKIDIGGGVVVNLAVSLPFLSDMIIDDSHIYFSENDTGYIKRIAKSGGNISTLSQAGLQFSWHDLTVDTSTLYWIDQLNIGKVPAAGGSTEFISRGPLWMDASTPASIVNDDINLYWTEAGVAAIKSMAKVQQPQP